MKSVLISIQPKWCEKICHQIGEENGTPVYEKRIEVRKSKPSEVPFKAYIYETKGATETPWVDEDGHLIFKGRGQVIGEFVCDKIFLLHPYTYDGGNADRKRRKLIQTFEGSSKENEILSATCLTQDEMFDYIGADNYGYGWHISDLKIYDKPKELSEFFTPMGKRPSYMVERPPQSWQYVEE